MHFGLRPKALRALNPIRRYEKTGDRSTIPAMAFVQQIFELMLVLSLGVDFVLSEIPPILRPPKHELTFSGLDRDHYITGGPDEFSMDIRDGSVKRQTL